MDETAARRTTRTPRRGYDIEQTHFFYREDLEAGATVVDHVTGEAVGVVSEVGRHVFEGYGGPGAGGGAAGDLVVRVVELEPAVVPAAAPPRDERDAGPGEDRDDDPEEGDEPDGEDTVEVPDDREPEDEATLRIEPTPERGRGALGASVVQGVAIAVLAPLLALGLLVLLLVLLVG